MPSATILFTKGLLIIEFASIFASLLNIFIVGITPTKETETTATAEVKITDECVVIAFPMFWI